MEETKNRMDGYAVKVKTVTLVSCMVCHAEHDIEGESFFTVAGNVYIGNRGGIIGNNFIPSEGVPSMDWDISGFKTALEIEAQMKKVVICRKKECLLKAFDLWE